MKKLQILLFSAMFMVTSAINEVHSQDIEDIAFFQSQEIEKTIRVVLRSDTKNGRIFKIFGEAYKDY